jgi:hypothetical protein
VEAEGQPKQVNQSLLTVLIAFLANLLLAIAKSVAAFVTSSASMLAEAAHSWADTATRSSCWSPTGDLTAGRTVGIRWVSGGRRMSGRCSPRLDFYRWRSRVHLAWHPAADRTAGSVELSCRVHRLGDCIRARRCFVHPGHAAVDMAGDDVEHSLAVRLWRVERELEQQDYIEEAVLTLATPDEASLTP